MKRGSRAHWGTRLGFILAASGSAIGLGNIWKFPYITGIHGGGIFVFIYLFCIAVIGLPVLLSEFIVGRAGQKNAVESFEQLEGGKTAWSTVGWMGVFTAFLLLSFYAVVAGWILHYTGQAITGAFSSGHDAEAIKNMLGALLGDGHYQTMLNGGFLILTMGIVMMGIKGGIEKASDILMPMLFGILLLLFLYSFTLEGNGKALEFLFSPKFDQLTPQGVLEAMGHAFFTLSVGAGVMITYGSYLGKKERMMKSAVQIALLDTLIALLAGVVIFSIVFSFDLQANGGPTLIFSTLPTLFVQMQGGGILSIAFFVLLTFAALTSAISMLETVVSYFVDHTNLGRKPVTLLIGFFAFLVGLLSDYSYNKLSDFKIPVQFLFGEELVFFDLFDKIVSNLMLPLGGLLVSIYVGWKLDRKMLQNEFSAEERKYLPLLILTLKYVCPILVGIVFLYGLDFTRPIFTMLGLVK